jgi:hypothetical protein
LRRGASHSCVPTGRGFSFGFGVGVWNDLRSKEGLGLAAGVMFQDGPPAAARRRNSVHDALVVKAAQEQRRSINKKGFARQDCAK